MHGTQKHEDAQQRAFGHRKPHGESLLQRLRLRNNLGHGKMLQGHHPRMMQEGEIHEGEQ
jgi:hypothetical protein